MSHSLLAAIDSFFAGSYTVFPWLQLPMGFELKYDPQFGFTLWRGDRGVGVSGADDVERIIAFNLEQANQAA